jgi:hypothetical protein
MKVYFINSASFKRKLWSGVARTGWKLTCREQKSLRFVKVILSQSLSEDVSCPVQADCRIYITACKAFSCYRIALLLQMYSVFNHIVSKILLLFCILFAFSNTTFWVFTLSFGLIISENILLSNKCLLVRIPKFLPNLSFMILEIPCSFWYYTNKNFNEQQFNENLNYQVS